MDSRERNRLLGAIKRCFSRSPYRRAALGKALSKKKGPRGGKMYRCSKCRKVFSSSSIQVDHLEPVIPIGRPFADMSWDEVIGRLYCEVENLQVLCKPCHTKKSSKEAAARAKARKESKC